MSPPKIKLFYNIWFGGKFGRGHFNSGEGANLFICMGGVLFHVSYMQSQMIPFAILYDHLLQSYDGFYEYEVENYTL